MPILTEELARKLPLPETGQKLIFDNAMSGFGLRLSKTARAWFVDVNQHRQTKRITIARVGERKLAEVRKEASRLRGSVELTPRAGRRGRPATVAELWERLVVEDEHRLRPRTKKLYAGYWNVHIGPALGTMTPAKVTPSDISTMLAKIPGNAHANRIHELTQRLFAFAVAHQWRNDNPAKGWRRRHETEKQTFLDDATLGKLFEALPVNEVGDALKFAAFTGARIGEVLTLTWSDLKDGGRTWIKPGTTTKQKRDHTVPLPLAAQELVARQARRGPSVFSRADGSAVKNCRQTWLWALRRARLSGIRIHDLRHTMASAMVNSGASLAMVGAALGHSSPSTTKRYAHIAQEALREAMEKATNIVPLRKSA